MISVIVPTYNQADLLARTLDSIWTQGVDDLEVVVVDDGSTDDTEAVLRRLSESAQLTIIRQENRGPAAARNRGIRESRGELVAFLDGDDFWLPGKLSAQLEALQRTGYRFSFCGQQTIDQDEKIVALRKASEKDCEFKELIWGNRISTPTVLVERTLLDECGLFDESLRTGEDWDMWLRFAAKGPGACVPEPLVAVRGSSRWRADANQLSTYEHSTNRVLGRIFELAESHQHLAHLKTMKGRIRSWHFAILAKSLLLDAHQFARSVLYAIRSVASSPRGLIYLMPTLRSQDSIEPIGEPASNHRLKSVPHLASGGQDARAPTDFEASVVVRTYNRAEMLQDALDSILNQTLPAKEIVVIDDGSTDSTADVIRRYQQKHSQIRYVQTKGNLGADRAARLGVEESERPHVAFLDSDDFWAPNHLENAAAEFRNHPDAVMVFSRYGLVNARCEPLVDLVKEPRLTSPLHQLVLKKVIVQPTRTVIRRQAIDEVGGVPLFPAAEDWVLAVLLAARFPARLIQSANRTAFFRLHSSQSASRPLHVRKALLDATEFIFSHIPSEFAGLKRAVIATNLLHSAVFFWQAGDASEAWRSLWRALKVRAWSVFTHEFWSTLSRLLVPPSVGRWLRGWKRAMERRRGRTTAPHTA